MKKRIMICITLIILLYFWVFNIYSNNIRREYIGYVYSELFPVDSVRVEEEGEENFTYTDKKGYFILNRKGKKSINNLTFYKKGYKVENINIQRGGGAGSRIYYLFLRDKIDTLQIIKE